MPGLSYFAVAALIMMLLPAVILPWEGRRVPDAIYAAIAVAGVAFSAVEGGAWGVLAAAGAGLGALGIVAAVVAGIRITLNLQILTGGHIKLLAAGATWLGITGSLAMIAIAFGALFASAAVQRMNSRVRRPDFAAIAALAILCVSVQQTLPLA